MKYLQLDCGFACVVWLFLANDPVGTMFSRAMQQVILREKKSRMVGIGSLAAMVHAFSSASSSSSQSQRLAGKVAVITGGASGIGKATAAEFVRHGARVVIADIQEDLGCAVAAELGPDNVCCYTHCDVTDEAQVAAAVDLAVARHGQLDIMFNNAAIGGSPGRPTIAAVDLADFDRVMAVNARGVLAGLKHAARVMVPSRRGSIICTASTAVLSGGLAAVPYSASKATVIGLVRAVAAEMGRSGVRVNAISPYAIPTPLALEALGSWIPGGKSAEEIKRMVEIDMNVMDGTKLEEVDIARAALYLASDDAKYVNGHNLVVDGGSTTVTGSAKKAGTISTPKE